MSVWSSGSIQNKTVKDYNDNTCIIYTWKIVSWELWKQPYPHTIHFKDKSVWILEYEEPVNEPYIVMETYPKEGSKNETQKSIYILKTRGKRVLKMGRAPNNELRINDISISRNHAEINISKDEKVYIRDCKSKFGTLILMKSPEPISASPDTLTLYQIGRSVLIFDNLLVQSSIGSSLWKLFSKKKEKSKDEEQQKSKNKYEVSKNSVDANLILEIEIDKLQKNNESEFYLDEEFYDRMADEFSKKKNQPAIHHSQIRFDDEEESNNTEVDDEENEEINPFAQTSDWKNNSQSLQQQLSRFRNAEQADIQINGTHIEENEEEKKFSPSLSLNNLEVRLEINAPQLQNHENEFKNVQIDLGTYWNQNTEL